MVSSTGLDEATDVLDLLPPPPLPKPGPAGEPLARRGHPGGPGFTAPDAPATDSVWQRAQAAWLAVGAEWSGAASAPVGSVSSRPGTRAPRSRTRPAPARRPQARLAPARRPRIRPAPARRPPGSRPLIAARWSSRNRQFLLVAVAVVLVLAVAGGGYAWYQAGRLGPRTYPAAQTGQLAAGPAAATGAGVFQSLTEVASSGGTVVAVGRQSGGDLSRAQFYVSTDNGTSWQLAPVRAASGGQPAPGHPAQLIVAGADGWLAVGPHAIWTSKDGRSWTLARTTGVTPIDSGDQVQLLIRTATGYLAAGQNTAEGAGVIWTSPDGLHWQRETAAQPLLEIRHGRGTIVTITGAAAHGPDILLSGQVDPWYESAGPHNDVTWLSTDSGQTWKSVSVPVSNGASTGLTGVAAAGSGFVAVRPTATGHSRGGVVYTSANGSSWHYATTLGSASGLKLTAVDGSAVGYSVLAQGSRGQLFGFTSTDGKRWDKAGNFGSAPGTTTGSTVTGSGVLIATGATSHRAGQQPFLGVAARGQQPQAVSVAGIAGATITQDGAAAVASDGQRQVAVGESGGTLAVWSGPAGDQGSGAGRFTAGTWATTTGQPPAVTGTQGLTSVVHGPAGWLATGTTWDGATRHPVAVSSADGRTWAPASSQTLTTADADTAQAAADQRGYVIVGQATTSAGTVPAVWWSANLVTWSRAGLTAGPSQLLGVAGGTGGTGGTGGFVAVGRTGIDPAVWTSPDGRQWTARDLKIPGTGARAQLSQVAVNGRTVVAFGQETWASGRQDPFAEVSHDAGRTWTPAPLKTPANSPTTVTAVTAMSGGFTAAGTYGPPGHRDVVIWTSATGNHWLTETPRGTGLTGPGTQQINGLAANGTALTGVGFTATSTTEHLTLWRVPTR